MQRERRASGSRASVRRDAITGHREPRISLNCSEQAREGVQARVWGTATGMGASAGAGDYAARAMQVRESLAGEDGAARAARIVLDTLGLLGRK